MKIRIVGGKIIETTKGNVNIFAKGKITYSSAKQVINTAKGGIIYGDPEPFPEIEEFLGNTIVELRPLVNMENNRQSTVQINTKTYDVYKGQFGFDWYQQHEVIPWISDKPVQIESLVKNGIKSTDPQGNTTPYETPQEALQAYRKTYQQFSLKRKYKKTEKYYIPYLTLFDQQTVTAQKKKMQDKEDFVPPPYQAAFNLYVDIEGKKPEQLWITKNEFFTTNWDSLNEYYYAVDVSSLVFDKYYDGLVSNIVLELTCIKQFDQYQKINIWAKYKENPVPEPAGRIIALPNSEKHIKRQKLILIDTVMNIENSTIEEEKQKGEFQPDHKKNLFYLHQFLILPEWEHLNEDKALDLTRHPDFKVGGFCIVGEERKGEKEKGKYNIRKETVKVHELLYQAFCEAKDEQGRAKYADYIEEGNIYLFSMGLPCNGGSTRGSTYSKKKLIQIFKPPMASNNSQNAISHECLHSLGVPHTFMDTSEGAYGSRTGNEETFYKMEPGKSFIFTFGKTLNLMDYSQYPYTSFYWQWKIVNPFFKI